MLKKSEKKKIIDDLAERFQRQKIAIFVDFHGSSVAKIQALRRAVKKSDAEYKVAKKTLLDRALEKASIQTRAKELKGELGIVFGFGDEVSPAKLLVKFAKNFETIKILGGVLGQKILKDKEILALAKLPSREVLLAQLLWVLQAPAKGLVMVLQAPMQNLVVVLDKIRSTKSPTGVASLRTEIRNNI